MPENQKSEKIKKLRDDLRRLITPRWKKVNNQIRNYRRKKEFRDLIEKLNEKLDEGEITILEWKEKRDRWIREHRD